MPWIAGGATNGKSPTRYALFGRSLHPITASDVNRLATEAPYACNRSSPDCDNQETRLDLVFQAIGREPADHLAVVVTDLWLSSAGQAEQGPAALAQPLSEMLQNGRSLGILGLKAPYKGLIYDIPNAAAYKGASSHPLLILLIGPVARVAAFRERLLRPGDTVIKADQSRWSLFTLDPSAVVATGSPTLEVRPGHGLRPFAVLPARPGLELPQLRTSAREAARAAGAGGEASFVPKPESSIRTGAVWRGALNPVTQVWSLSSPGAVCRSPRAWREMGSLRGGWTLGGTAEAPTARFALTATGAINELGPGHIYLIAGGLKRSGLTVPNPANAWMRAWSFDAATAPEVLASRPAFFPTLNLGRTATLMEDALDQASKEARTPGFAAIVKVDR